MQKAVFIGFFLFLALAACQAPAPELMPVVAPDAAPAVHPEAEQWLAMLTYPDDDRDAERRLAALRLGLQRQEQARDTLIKQLHGDRDEQVRAACAFALGRIGGDKAVEALAWALDDPAREVRLAVVRALTGQVDPLAEEVLKALVKTDDLEVALAARAVLEEAGFTVDDQWRTRGAVPEPDGERQVPVYVDPFRATENPDGSAEKPWPTVAEGLARLQPGGILYVAGAADRPVREAIVVAEKLSGSLGRPTLLAAWPNRPRPLLQPTRELAAGQFTRDENGRWRAKVEFAVEGVFVESPSGGVKIYPLLDETQPDTPGTCRYDKTTGEVALDTDGKPLTGRVELAFAPDALRLEGAHDVIVSGFAVRYAPDTGIEANGGRRISCLACEASHCDRHGIFFFYSPEGLVDGGRAADCSYQGVSVRSSPHTVVHDVDARRNGRDGILFLYDSDDGLAVACRARDNGRGVAFIESSDGGRVIGGAVSDNRERDVYFDPTCRGGRMVPRLP